MPQFMLAAYTSDEPPPPMTDERIQQGFAVVEAIEAEMRAQDALVYSGRLLEPSRAKVVRPRGRPVSRATDGPYIETKEHLGGFYIIEAPNLDAALVWATKVSDAIDSPLEVRPFMNMPRP